MPAIIRCVPPEPGSCRLARAAPASLDPGYAVRITPLTHAEAARGDCEASVEGYGLSLVQGRLWTKTRASWTLTRPH